MINVYHLLMMKKNMMIMILHTGEEDGEVKRKRRNKSLLIILILITLSIMIRNLLLIMEVDITLINIMAEVQIIIPITYQLVVPFKPMIIQISGISFLDLLSQMKIVFFLRRTFKRYLLRDYHHEKLRLLLCQR